MTTVLTIIPKHSNKENFSRGHITLDTQGELLDLVISDKSGFQGKGDQNCVDVLAIKTEKHFDFGNVKIRKRTISCLIELFQNLDKHAIIDQNQPAKFSIEKDNNFFHIKSENACDSETFEGLKGVEDLNNFTLEEIKEAYKEQLKNGKLSDKGGAGLGMLGIAKILRNKDSDQGVMTINNRKNTENKEKLILLENIGTEEAPISKLHVKIPYKEIRKESQSQIIG